MASVPTAPTPPSPSDAGRWKRICLRAVAGGAFLVGAWFFLQDQADQAPDRVYGDAWEYWYQAESFHRHGTPDLWQSDVEAVNNEAAQSRLGAAPPKPYAYVPTRDDRMYSMHFWAYGVSVVPAKAYLEWTGGNQLTALRLTNALWFVLAMAVTLFVSSVPVGQRLALAGLATVGPCLWYFKWHGAEMYCWSLVLMAVVMYRDRRYSWCALAAGLAAMQNPPIIFLGAFAVLAAAWDRQWWTAARAILGTAVGLIPYGFYQYHFGVPNLIVVTDEYAGVRNLSWVRSWGLITDFNHGLLPYMPLLVVGTSFGVMRLLYTRNVRGLLLVSALVSMAVGLQVAHNWNSSCEGLQRYLLWMVPLAAGIAVEGIGGRWRLWAFAAIAICGHLAIHNEYNRTQALKDGYLSNTPVGEWVLNNYPRAYWVEPEVFVERHRRSDGWPYFTADWPIVHVRPNGTVSKMLLEPASVEKVNERFAVDPDYMTTLREQAARESGRFYAHPPHGAVRQR